MLLEVFALLLTALLLKFDFFGWLCLLSTLLGSRLRILFAVIGSLGALGLLQFLDEGRLVHSVQIKLPIVVVANKERPRLGLSLFLSLFNHLSTSLFSLGVLLDVNLVLITLVVLSIFSVLLLVRNVAFSLEYEYQIFPMLDYCNHKDNHLNGKDSAHCCHSICLLLTILLNQPSLVLDYVKGDEWESSHRNCAYDDLRLELLQVWLVAPTRGHTVAFGNFIKRQHHCL